SEYPASFPRPVAAVQRNPPLTPSVEKQSGPVTKAPVRPMEGRGSASGPSLGNQDNLASVRGRRKIMRIRGLLTRSLLGAKIGPQLRPARHGYPLLQARGRWGILVIPREDAELFELVEATADERQDLADAGYELSQAVRTERQGRTGP